MMEQEKHKNWPSLLPKVMYILNTSKSSSTKFMPYVVTFNRRPNTGEAKKFLVLDKGLKEVPIEIEGTDTEAATSEKTPKSTSKSAIAPSSSESDTDSVPIAAMHSRLRSQATANANREHLNANKVKNGDLMIKKHDHKRNKVTREFHVEHLVTVKIPRIDRASTDFRRMPALVCKVTTHGDKSNGDRMHHLLTAYGTLNDHYRTGDLEPLVGGVVDAVKEDYLKRMISMTEAARLQAACTGSLEAVKAMCNCNSGCQQDRRCTCFKAGLKCTSHCHGKLVTGKNKAKIVKKNV